MLFILYDLFFVVSCKAAMNIIKTKSMMAVMPYRKIKVEKSRLGEPVNLEMNAIKRHRIRISRENAMLPLMYATGLVIPILSK